MISTDLFNELLTKEKSKLEEELSHVGRRNPSNPNDWEPTPPDRGETASDLTDIAERSTTFDTHAAIVADLENRYNDVVAALGRIASNTYGLCKISGEPIEEARLNADPAAQTCLKHLGQ